MSSQFSVLLVSGSPDRCGKLASLLRSNHCDVYETATCRQAVPLLSQEVAVVLTDPHLPDGDWKQLTAEARRLERPPSIIVVSDASDWKLWADVLTAGGYDLLTKPWTPESVGWMVESAYRRWQRGREVDTARRSNALS